MSGIGRREFIQGSLVTGAALGLVSQGLPADTTAPRSDADEEIIDTQVWLGRWPFRHLFGDEPAELVAQLRRERVTRGWAGSFEGLTHRDMAAVNAHLAETCRQHGDGLLIPLGTINPMLPDWEEDLRRCDEVHRMPGVRLHPNYHGYTLSDPVFSRLLELADSRGLLVQLVAWMEDERHQSPLMPVPSVDLAPLAEKARAFPKLRILVTNGFMTAREASLEGLLPLENVFFDIARLEGIDGLDELLRHVPAERVVFGSNSPLFYFESTRLKLRESVLSEEQTRGICVDTARRLISDAGKRARGA